MAQPSRLVAVRKRCHDPVSLAERRRERLFDIDVLAACQARERHRSVRERRRDVDDDVDRLVVQQGLDRLVGTQVVELGRSLRPRLVDVGTAEDPDRASLRSPFMYEPKMFPQPTIPRPIGLARS